MENKPKLLYRGLKINYNNLQNFAFSGVDLTVNYEPIIDQYGRKTVTDGNEYGVYMTDNLSMVTAAYGNLHHDGTPIYNNLLINNERIMIPSVAVIYEINTDGLDVKKPFISDQLRGHYNNGFQGNEWIAELVPANNYRLYRVRVGADILHETEDIDLEKTKNISQEIKQKLEMRKYRLETFANAMSKIPSIKRNLFGKSELEILKSIYGENGLKYINEDTLVTTEIDGMLKYLATKTFKQNEMNIDFQTIKYIRELQNQATDIASLIETLNNEKIRNLQEKILFEERKKQSGQPYATSKFDNQEKRINSLLTMINLRTKKDVDSQMFMEEEIGKENPRKKIHRPKISNEVIEIVKRKHEKEELTKMKEHVINMAEEQKRKELEQQVEIEEEEDLGMSR